VLSGGGGYGLGLDVSASTGGTRVIGGGLSVRRGRRRRYDSQLYGLKRVGRPAWFLFRGIGIRLSGLECFPMTAIERMEAFVWRKLSST